MFWQLQGRCCTRRGTSPLMSAAHSSQQPKIETPEQLHVSASMHPSINMCSVPSNGATQKKKKSAFLWRVSEHLVLTVHLSMWVLGNARTALTGRRVLGKGKKQKSGFPLENKQTFVSEEREKTVWLTDCPPAFSGSGWRTRQFQKLEKHTYNTSGRTGRCPVLMSQRSKCEEIILEYLEPNTQLG